MNERKKQPRNSHKVAASESESASASFLFMTAGEFHIARSVPAIERKKNLG